MDIWFFQADNCFLKKNKSLNLKDKQQLLKQHASALTRKFPLLG
jgi:hypothetical protein